MHLEREQIKINRRVHKFGVKGGVGFVLGEVGGSG